MSIHIDMDTDGIHGLSIGSGNDWTWSLLEPMDIPGEYELTTTLHPQQQKFLINIPEATSKRIE